ncbi:BnaUnng03270D, partial [Brassica napus]
VLTPYLAGIIQPISCSTQHLILLRSSKQGTYPMFTGWKPMENLPDDSLALTNNDSSQWSVGTATSIRARFFVLNERLTIGEIIDSSVVYRLHSSLLNFLHICILHVLSVLLKNTH